jgi:predicted Zn-dependent peptidase
MHRPAMNRATGALCLFLPLMLNAQLDRSLRPQPGPAPEVRLGEHSSFDLPNGMKVVVVENHKLPLVAVQLRFDVPPVAFDAKAGLAELFGELLATGTANRGKAEIDLAVDRMGATLVTTPEGLYLNGVKRHLPAFMELAADIARNASFPEPEFQAALARARSSVKQRRDDPSAIAEVAARAVAFGRTHAYGEVTTERSLAGLRASDLRAYHAYFFRPDRACLVLVGDLTVKEARDLAGAHFGKWKKPKTAWTGPTAGGVLDVPGLGLLRTPMRALTPSLDRRVYVVDRPGAPQSVVRVTFPLNLHPADVRALSAQVMNTILGGGVFNARLMQNLREDKGWTYGCYSTTEADRVNGLFTVSVSVRTEVTADAVREILRELERMRSEPVTAQELDLAKRYMAGAFGRGLEDPRTVARFAVNTWLNQLPKDHYATYLQRLEAITAQDVTDASRAFLRPEQASVLVVGDRKELWDKLRPIGLDRREPIQLLDVDAQPWKEDVKPVTDRTAEQVVETHLFASGGRDRIAALHQLRIVSELEVGGATLERTRWFGLNDRYREEVRANGQLLGTVIFDGERAVSRSPQGDEELTDIDLFDLRMNALPIPDMKAREFAERSVLNGSIETKEGGLYKVTTFTTAGTSVIDYYAVRTGLKVRRTEQKFMHGQNLQVTTEFGDYRPAVGGVLFPHRIEQSGGHMGAMVETIKEVSTTFTVPANFYETGLPGYDEDEGDFTFPPEEEMKDE